MTEPAAAVDLCFASARELAALLRRRELSARELMAAHLARIERINPTINAIVAKLDDDACLTLADGADDAQGGGAMALAWLAALCAAVLATAFLLRRTGQGGARLEPRRNVNR